MSHRMRGSCDLIRHFITLPRITLRVLLTRMHRLGIVITGTVVIGTALTGHAPITTRAFLGSSQPCPSVIQLFGTDRCRTTT